MKVDVRNFGFHWHGRTREGVSKWTGSIKPLLWVARGFGIYGPVAGITGIIALAPTLAAHHFSGPVASLAYVGLIHGAVFSSLAWWARAMYRHVMRLTPAAEVSARMGVDEASLKQLAQERGVKPRMLLNDEPYYDASELSDALSLLRGSSAQQVPPDALLRPVSGTPAPEPDALLRAAAADSPETAARTGSYAPGPTRRTDEESAVQEASLRSTNGGRAG